MKRWQSLLLLVLVPLAACSEDETLIEIEPLPRGPLAVGSTNMEVAETYADIGDDAMHSVLIGQALPWSAPRLRIREAGRPVQPVP